MRRSKKRNVRCICVSKGDLSWGIWNGPGPCLCTVYPRLLLHVQYENLSDVCGGRPGATEGQTGGRRSDRSAEGPLAFASVLNYSLFPSLVLDIGTD